MKKLILPLCIAILFTACTRHYHPLDAGKKAKLVTELINDSSRCKPFKERLASPTMDDDAIDEVYHEATRAQCLNEHV